MTAFAAPASAVGTTHYVSPFPSAGADLSCDLPGFNTIQMAVDVSAPGDTIVVCPGVYQEQVRVYRSLTLTGSNATIKAPAVLTGPTPNTRNIVDVFGATSTTPVDVVMSGFIVSGPGPGPCGSIDSGIGVRDGATLDLSYTTVRDVRDQPFSGCQNGEGIRVGTPRNESATPQIGHAVIDHVVVTRYQKNGITVAGPGSTAKITNSTTTGMGKTTVIAQNGVQVSSGATATVNNNVIRDNYYTPKGTVACGLLIFNASGVTESENTYQGNEQNKCTVSGRGGNFQE